jgi:hypothetical protein
MKKGTKIGIVVAVIAILLLCCCSASAIGWFFAFGPGSYQTAKANTLVGSANNKFAAINKASQNMETSATSLSAALSQDASTASIQNFKDQVTKLESQAQENIDSLNAADKDLASAKQLRMPAWYASYLDTLIKRDAALKDGLASLQKAFSESRKMVDSLTSVVDGVDKLTTGVAAFEQITTLMTSGNYAGALAKVGEADGSLQSAEKALTTANASIDSLDIKAMIDLSAKYREVLPLMTSFLQAAQAQDLTTMQALQTQLTAKLSETSKAANAVGASGDFETLFAKSVNKFNDQFKAKGAEAMKLEKQAQAIYDANN